jgi:hypothetical protein
MPGMSPTRLSGFIKGILIGSGNIATTRIRVSEELQCGEPRQGCPCRGTPPAVLPPAQGGRADFQRRCQLDEPNTSSDSPLACSAGGGEMSDLGQER